MKRLKLDKEEKELLDSYDRGEWQSVKNVEEQIKKHRIYARNALKKDKRVNIRIPGKDLENIQIIAVEEGIPYQTLMASVLHKFASDRLAAKS